MPSKNSLDIKVTMKKIVATRYFGIYTATIGRLKGHFIHFFRRDFWTGYQK